MCVQIFYVYLLVYASCSLFFFLSISSKIEQRHFISSNFLYIGIHALDLHHFVSFFLFFCSFANEYFMTLDTAYTYICLSHSWKVIHRILCYHRLFLGWDAFRRKFFSLPSFKKNYIIFIILIHFLSHHIKFPLNICQLK